MERLKLSAAIGGVWSVLMVELVSSRSCRDDADTGSCRTARRWVGELPGVEAVLEGVLGATEAI